MQSLYLTVVIVLAWFVLCAVMWRQHRLRQDKDFTVNTSVLIAYASQTGNAEVVAQQCATALNLPINTSIIPLNNLTLKHLTQLDKVLFVVSTYGDGEAPDNGSLFIGSLSSDLEHSELYKKHTALEHVNYSIIALGDRTYPDFCAFGYQLNDLMLDYGANSLSDVITVNDYDEKTIELVDITPNWLKAELQSQPKQVTNAETESSQYWQLTQRELLNPDCNSEGLFRLTLQSIGPAPLWQAGDLLDVQPQQPEHEIEDWLLKNKLDGNTWLTYQNVSQPLKIWLLTRELSAKYDSNKCSHSIDELLISLPLLRKRSYSIASIPQEGKMELIVRLFNKSDADSSDDSLETNNAESDKPEKYNRLGLASGFLSHYSQLGAIIQADIKTMSTHHLVATESTQQQSIILIGAGSGLAGLKAQIAQYSLAKKQQASGNIWLIFGERNSELKLPINQYLTSIEDKLLTKLSRAYSQDKQFPQYVQHILLSEQKLVKQWIDNGSVIYVCGSLSGMGEGVHQALVEILGQTEVDTLKVQQRYIRDVY